MSKDFEAFSSDLNQSTANVDMNGNLCLENWQDDTPDNFSLRTAKGAARRQARRDKKLDARLARKDAKTNLKNARADYKRAKGEAKITLAQQGLQQQSGFAEALSSGGKALGNLASGLTGGLLGGGGGGIDTSSMAQDPPLWGTGTSGGDMGQDYNYLQQTQQPQVSDSTDNSNPVVDANGQPIKKNNFIIIAVAGAVLFIIVLFMFKRK